MSAPVVQFDKHEGLAVITLNRPDVLNSLNTTMADELVAIAADVAADRSVGAVVVAGAGGKAFCAGADISEFGALASPAEFHCFIANLRRAVEAIAALPQVVVAGVEGVAFGGGCELAMACDMRTASERTRFGLPEIRLGLLPGLGGTQRAVRLLPQAVGLRMLLTGEPLDAETAHRVGFCEPPVEAGRAVEDAVRLATALSTGPRLALAAAKRLVREGIAMELQSAIDLEQDVVRQLFATTDAHAGLSAFLAKRTAVFSGE